MKTHLAVLIPAALLVGGAAVAQPAPPTMIWEQAVDAVSVTYSADGAHVAAAGIRRHNPYTYGRIDVFAAVDGAEVAYRQSHWAAAILGRTNRLALSPDGETLASAHGGVLCTAMFGCGVERPGLFTWSFPDLLPIAGRTDLTPAEAVEFAQVGVRFAVGYFYDNSGLVRVHDPATLAEEQVLPGHQYKTADVAYSPDGLRLATVGDDGLLRVWDAITGDPVYVVQHGTLGMGGRPISVAFSPDGSRIATAGSGFNVRVKVWEAATGGLLLDIDGLLEAGSQGDTRIAFTPNGMYLVGVLNQSGASGGHWQGRIRFWDAASGEILEEYADSGPPPYQGGVRSIAFSEAENHRFAYVVGTIGVVKMAETGMSLRDLPVGNEPMAEGGVSVEVFPNPIIATATVRLTVEEPQVVRVEVVDVLGRRVGVLHDGEVSAGGMHEIAFDTSSLAGGAYVVRIAGETFSETRRVTVVR